MQAHLVTGFHGWLPLVGMPELIDVPPGSILGLVVSLLTLPLVSHSALPPVSHIGSTRIIDHLVTERAMAAIAFIATSSLDAYVELPLDLLVGVCYSKYDDSDPLDHEVRAAITETVDTTPGIYLSDLSERTNVPLSTLRHHLQVLETERVLTSTKIRGKRRYFPIHSTGHALIAALSEAATAAILETLWRNGPSSVSSVAAAIDRDPSTVSYHLRRLEVDAVVEREQDGRVVMTKLSQRTRTVFERADLAGQNGETATAIGGESGHV